MLNTGIFSLSSLYEALDADRKARGLSWRQLMHEINGPFHGTTSRPISLSTVTSLRVKPVAEGDGVLQMLRWLDRVPESFIPGYPFPEIEDHKLPGREVECVVRMHTRKLHAALNARRVERKLTWKQAAAEIGGVAESSLTHLAKGGRTGFPWVMRMTGWLDEPLARFTRLTPF